MLQATCMACQSVCCGATGLMQNLVSMELDANNLEGTLPAAWAAFKSLKLMDLSTNYLTGALPTDWTGSPNLTLLLLGNNGFQGNQQRSITALNQWGCRLCLWKWSCTFPCQSPYVTSMPFTSALVTATWWILIDSWWDNLAQS